MQPKFFAATIACCSIALVGCQEYDFDFTSEEIFRGAYERNFTDSHGKIDPDETWDLSDAGGRRGHSGAVTRARAEYESVASSDGWYYVQDGTLSWMKQQLPEQKNSKSKINAFAMTWTKGVEFEIVPIYEGLATASWDLQDAFTGADANKDGKISSDDLKALRQLIHDSFSNK